MSNAIENRLSSQSAALLLRTAFVLVFSLTGWLDLDLSQAQDALSPKKRMRELLVPFDDLSIILQNQPDRVYLTRDEYNEMLAKSQKATETAPPQAVALLEAEFSASVLLGQASIEGRIRMDVLADGLHAVPLVISGVGIQQARFNGEPAALALDEHGQVIVFVEGKGQKELVLNMQLPITTASAQQSIQFQLPVVGASTLRMAVLGNVEVKSGAQVIQRTVDGVNNMTVFDLVLQPAPMSIVMSLNNRSLRETKVVVSKTVLVDEVTMGYERLHASFSMNVLHGATDRYSFALPEGFDISDVQSQSMARWSIEQREGKRVLDVYLRSPQSEKDGVTELIQVSASRPSQRDQNWQFPRIVPLEVASNIAIVGVLAEDRIQMESIDSKGLITVDNQVMRAALPESVFRADSNSPQVRPMLAYYAPNEDYLLAAQFRLREQEQRATTNLLLIANERGLDLQAGFAIVASNDKLFQVVFSMPTDWQVVSVQRPDHGDLVFENRTQDGQQVVRVPLPAAIPAGQVLNLVVNARSVPKGWLADWTEQEVEFPRVELRDVSADIGACAIQVDDDLVARPSALNGLTILNANEKAVFHLSDVPTSLAYRYDSQPWSARIRIERLPSRVTAKSYSFFKIEPDGLTAHYELDYSIEQARTQRLAFSLPMTTPSEVSIVGLDGLQVKETSSSIVDQRRFWDVLLAARQTGNNRIAVDFIQPLTEEEPKGWELPAVRAEGVAFQSGMIAIEGHAELETEVVASPRRVDMGELVDANYKVGRRLLGSFGFVGDDSQVVVDVARRIGHSLPTTIAERAELISVLSNTGLAQTVGRFRLRTKAQFLRIQLPSQSTLWSMALDGKPALPQRNGEHLVVDLLANQSQAIRDLQVVYETPIGKVDYRDQVELAAPRISVAEGPSDAEVPLADLQWQLYLPNGYRVTQSNGSVYTAIENPNMLKMIGDWLYQLGGGVAETRYAKVTEGRVAQTSQSEWAFDYAVPQSRAVPNFDGPVAGIQTPPTNAFPKSEEYKENFDRDASQTQVQEQLKELTPVLGAPADGQVAAQPMQPPMPPAKKPTESKWALDGLRSLNIDFAVPASQATTFQSFGGQPKLQATVSRYENWNWLAAAVLFVAIAISLGLLYASYRTKVAWVLLLVFVGFSLPSITNWQIELGQASQSLVIAAIVSVILFVLHGWWTSGIAVDVKRSKAEGFVSRTTVLTLVLLSAMSTASPSFSQVPIVDKPEDVLRLLDSLNAAQPLAIPGDAIIVPYDPNNPDAMKGTTKVLVPLAVYEQLQKAIDAEQRPEARTVPAPYAIRGVRYQTTLNDEDSLLIEGRMGVELFVDGSVAIPVPLQGGVLITATLDNQPARLILAQPVGPGQNEGVYLLHASGKGVKEFAFTVRLKLERRGGWRVAEGRLPPTASSLMVLQVPQSGTDVQMRGVLDRSEFSTKGEMERVETTLARDGNFAIQWRPKVSEANVDQGMSIDSLGVLDVQENGLRLAWRMAFEFRRGRRDAFRVVVPKDYFVEKVVGDNIRGWTTTMEENQQLIEVRLLNTASEKETFTLFLAKNQALGGTASTALDVPAIRAEQAMLQTGSVVIRRSQLLELRTDRVNGLNRVEAIDEATLGFAGAGSSPIPLKPFQSFRFSSPNYQLSMIAEAIQPKVQVTSHSLLKISPRELILESRWTYQVKDRPVHRLRIALPSDFELEPPTVPGAFEWYVRSETNSKIVEILLADGHVGDFAVVVRAKARRGSPDDPNPMGAVVLPQTYALDVERQQGTIVIQADPSFDIRADDLRDCEIAKLEQTNNWLSDQQRSLARLAIQFRNPNYQGNLSVARRQPLVNAMSITNVRVTDRAIEETMLLDWKIRESGIQQVSFVVPYWMADARITAPMTREITKTPLNQQPQSDIRIRIDLQDEIINEFRVVLENDRPITAGELTAPIPTIETGTTDRRYVTIENAGRDEIVTKSLVSIESLDRQQAEWRSLSTLLGGKAAQAYIVRNTNEIPKFTYETTERTAVATVGARIGLARAMLAIDEAGTYRGLQEYRMENRTEQYLEVELPVGAELWTAIVADEPVKPIRAANSQKVRIPLVKTAEGDLDYGVFLKYGGSLESLQTTPNIQFPLIRALNIRSELSQVRLRLPERYRWYGFSGSMGRVMTEADLTAGWLSFKNKQVEQLTQVLRQSTSNNAFSKARASANLRQLGAQLRGESQNYSLIPQSEELRSQIQFNDLAIQQAEDAIAEQQRGSAQVEVEDNRKAIKQFYNEQGLQNSVNVVKGLGGNFSSLGEDKAKANETDFRFDANSFQGKPANIDESKAGRVLAKDLSQQSTSDFGVNQNPTATKLGRAAGAKADAAQSQMQRGRASDLQSQANRYQAALENSAGQGQQLEMGQTALPGMGGGGMPNMGGRGGMPGGGGMANALSLGSGPGQVPGSPQGDLFAPQNGQIMAPFGNADISGNQMIAGEVMASLDVELPMRGQEFLFTTPGDNVTLSARGVSKNITDRAINLAIAVAAVLACLIAARIVRAIISRVWSRRLLIVGLLLIGIASLMSGVLPIYGLASLILAIVWTVSNWRASVAARLLPEVQ